MRALPATMLLQIAVSVVEAAIAVLALVVARRATISPPRHRHAWRLTGATFLLLGVNGGIQNGFGCAAILAGRGTQLWESYLRWAPALNYSRDAAELMFLGLVVLLAYGRPVPVRTSMTGLLLASAFGLLVGLGEGTLLARLHYGRVAVLDVLLFALWALALSACVLRDAVDRLLLGALVLSVVPLPLNALWFGWLTRAGTGVWMPRPVDMQSYRLALHLGMLLLAAERWRLARRAVPVRGLAA